MNVIKLAVHSNIDGLCGIHLDNIGLRPETMKKCVRIIKHFTKCRELFFGHYRTDGINLKNEQWLKYEKEIPEYFKKNGRYESLNLNIQKKKKIKQFSGYLTVASSLANDELYEILPNVFHYYLETICFCPKIDWITFIESYRHYMKHGANEYVLNGFTDFLFSYTDSGDFSISFNQRMNKECILQDIQRILSE